MKVMITGSRDWRDLVTIRDALLELRLEAEPYEQIYIIQGCASGADAIARSAAEALEYLVQDEWPEYFDDNAQPLDFAEANKKRNIAMLDLWKPEKVLAFPTARSRGTWHAVSEAKKRGIEVKIYEQKV